MAGRIHAADITRPLQPDGHGRNQKVGAGNEVIAQATDITINKASGLWVYITSGMSVYISSTSRTA